MLEPGSNIKPVMEKDDAVTLIKQLYGLQVQGHEFLICWITFHFQEFQSVHKAGVTPVLPHRARTNFTPWCDTFK